MLMPAALGFLAGMVFCALVLAAMVAYDRWK